MNRSNFRLEIDSFRSIVARRIFLLFVLCAFLPLAALAFLSLSRVSRHLEDVATLGLHDLTKSAGMSIYERLLLLEGELKLYAGRLELASRANGVLPTSPAVPLVDLHFRKVSVRPALWAFAPPEGVPDRSWRPGSPAWKHLQSGQSLLVPGGRGGAIEMVRLMRTHGGREMIVVGGIAPDYLLSAGSSLPEGRSVFLVDESGHPIFSSFGRAIPIAELRLALRRSPATGDFRFTRTGDGFLASYWTIFTRPQFLNSGWVVVGVQARSEVLKPIRHFRRIFFLVALLSFWGILLLSFIQIRRILIPIALLKDATRKIGRKDLESKVHIQSNDEFEDLGRSFNEMVDRIRSHLQVMQTVNEIGLSLSSSMDSRRILEIVLRGAKNVLHADGAGLYVRSDKDRLHLALQEIDSPGLTKGFGFEDVAALGREESRSIYHALATRASQTGEMINVPDVHALDVGGNAQAHARDHAVGSPGESVLTVPLKDHNDDLIGVIQLINARDPQSQATRGFTAEDEHLLGSLASQAAVTFMKNRLYQDFKRLFESLIDLVVTAIDEKSPHTGNHCKRVPILAMMLADAACKSQRGKLKDFALSEQEMYELKVAALLHDCGKVTTPVHIMDKSTKLEKLFDRIILVDTRFQVVKATMQQEFLRERGAEESEEQVCEAQRRREARLRELHQDRDFIRSCNVGREAMDPAHAWRVREIARKYRWVNPDGEEVPILTEEEVHNLTVLNGTLTPEDREIVNYHIVATTKMLEALPYPKYLRRVPLYAGAHHERMDGQGYPQGLRGEEIPIQSRILAIADIFEALTAEDRPYRSRTSLSEGLRMLRTLAKQGQIDSDLVDVFIEEKVFLRYAERHLDPEQIDEEFLTQLDGLHP